MVVLEAPVREKQTTDRAKFCHILCDCHPTLALCGAYKPVRCNIAIVEKPGEFDKCSVCNRDYCPDCNKYIYACPRCGE